MNYEPQKLKIENGELDKNYECSPFFRMELPKLELPKLDFWLYHCASISYTLFNPLGQRLIITKSLRGWPAVNGY